MDTRRQFIGNMFLLRSLQTAGDGSYQVSCGMDRSLRIWD